MKKKRLISFSIALILLFSLLSTISFANSSSDVNFFLEKIATSKDKSKKDFGITALKIYLDTENPDVESLKNIIKISAADEDIKKLENEGYTLDEALQSLDVFKQISRSDTQNIIKSIENSNLNEVKSIISSYTNPKSNESNSDEKATNSSEKTIDVKESTTSENVYIFKDLDNHWAKDDIEFLTSKGIVKGKDKENFNPNEKINRAEFTALVIRLLDLKEISSDNYTDFKDVKSNDWFYNTVKIAQENKIINGVGKEEFAPYKEVSREEMITIVMRALKELNINSGEYKNISIDKFTDKAEISNWALENVDKAVKLEIIKGKNEDIFDSKGVTTRSEAATIIKRVFDRIKK